MRANRSATANGRWPENARKLTYALLVLQDEDQNDNKADKADDDGCPGAAEAGPALARKRSLCFMPRRVLCLVRKRALCLGRLLRRRIVDRFVRHVHV